MIWSIGHGADWAGGGIVSTVSATQDADEERLLADALPRFDALIAEGVGTVEIKSGYGIDLETEFRMLRVARRIGEMRPVTVVTSFLGAHVVPVIPAQGSVGASGDLAPLAHMAALMIGEGEAVLEGGTLPGGVALSRAGLVPVVLGPKEGLALIDGTQFSTACASGT